MRIHKRHKIVSAAKSEISEAVTGAIKNHDLTYGEIMSILANEIRSWAGFMIQDEREEDDEKDNNSIQN